MNRLNFNQSGGFPLQTETLDEMQKATTLFNKFGDLAGNFAIVSGCVVTGSIVSDGAVYINGELLEFRGGSIGPNVIIVEEVTAKEFEDGTDKDVLYVRYATIGTATTVYPWANFKRPKTTIELTEQKAEQTLIDTLIARIEDLEARPAANVPIGMIAIWGQDASLIPAGWIEHVPLQGKMPIGLDPNYVQGTDTINYNLNTLGATGGTRQHQLTIGELPEHDHEVGFQNIDLAGSNDGSLQELVAGPTSSSKVRTTKVGGNQKHNIMSPYRVVHFIKYVGI